MTEKEARSHIIHACHNLLEEKLVARTWGNISARLSDDEFIITPSGMSYLNLREEDLVKVKMPDCSYDGDRKPSSEKKIHAYAYATHSDVNFVIHTHQYYASVVCAACADVENIPCAGYGLAGTKKLAEALLAAFAAHPESDAFLMARHGALILGTDEEAAFARARKIEETCKRAFEEHIKTATPVSDKELAKPYLDDFAQIGLDKKSSVILAAINAPVDESNLDDDEAAFAYICKKNADAARYAYARGPLGFFDSHLQNLVYRYKYSKLK